MRNVHIVSLGCAKNLCDTQGMIGQLCASGWRLTDSADGADAIIVNTCSFIRAAREESRREIKKAIAHARHCRKPSQVIVAGCWAQDAPETLAQTFPEVKAFLGTGELQKISHVLGLPGTSLIIKGKPGGWLEWDERKYAFPAGGSANLRISEGCSHGCTFCTIPRLRGPYVNRSHDDIMQEVGSYASRNIKEINLIGQDTTAFTYNRHGGRGLEALLKRIIKYDSFRFIRILYAYPKNITDRLLSLIRNESAVCRYLDLPLQHISSPILKRMGRPFNEIQTRELIKKILCGVPGIALRTTFIVGFPGETEQDFLKLLDFVKQGFFMHVGVFVYSREKHTAAAHFNMQIPGKIKQERRHILLSAQQQIVRKKNVSRIGRVYDVMVTRRHGAYAAGRSEFEAPGVDGMIFFTVDPAPACRSWVKKSRRLAAGDMCRVTITEEEDYDCYGVLAS